MKSTFSGQANTPQTATSGSHTVKPCCVREQHKQDEPVLLKLESETGALGAKIRSVLCFDMGQHSHRSWIVAACSEMDKEHKQLRKETRDIKTVPC